MPAPLLAKRARAASMVEYALLLFAVLIVAAVSVKTIGPRVRMAGDVTTGELQ